jgi:hypothetical protein
MAALVSLYVGVMFAVAAVLGQDVSGFGVSGFGLVVGAYWVGGLLAGAVAGLGRPMSHWPLGRMLVGIPVTAAVYGAVWMAIRLMDGPFAEAGSPVDTAVLLVFSLCAGPAGGLMMGAMAKE